MQCPKCSGDMWDNRTSKKNPKQPDFKCKDREGCDGAVWPEKEKKAANGAAGKPAATPAPDAAPTPAVAETPAAEGKADLLLKTCKMHLAITRFVSENESPVLHNSEVGDSPEALSARINTVFIQACQMGLHR